MEAREAYNTVVEGIDQLEQQLVSIVEEGKENAKHGAEAKEELENFFARYEEALAARKQALLRELNETITAQKKAEVDAQEELRNAIKARRNILEAGSYLYGIDINTADHVWQGATILPWPHASVGRVQLDPDGFGSFFELILVLGKDALTYKKSSLKRTLEDSIAKEITMLARSTQGFADGDGDQAQFRCSHGIYWNPHDKCLYLCDRGNNAIRRITLQGQVSTLARAGLVSGPTGIAMHYKTNTFFVTNIASHSVCKITASGSMSVHAGGQRGSEDGLGTSARLNHPRGIAIDQHTDIIYVSDCHSIRKITLQGAVTTLAGSAKEGDADGNGSGARFNAPSGLWFDEKHQSLLVCDNGNNKLKRVSLEGDVSTVCAISGPTFVTTANTAILVSTLHGKIFRVTEAGEASILQQHAESGETKECQFNNHRLSGLALDEATNTCFVVDSSAHDIKKIAF